MHDIVHELTIAASPTKVYGAVTSQTGLAGWWTTDCTASAEVDSEATFGFADHSVVFTMRIDLLEPPELVHWECTGGPDEWIGTKLAFRIENLDGDRDEAADAPTEAPPEGERSLVRFWHGGWEYEDGMLPSCSFQWAMYLDSLRRFVETGKGSPNTD